LKNRLRPLNSWDFPSINKYKLLILLYKIIYGFYAWMAFFLLRTKHLEHYKKQGGEMRKNQIGFTLIEIAIVLVIIGLLLGGVLKGQELIQNARVRNIIAQQDGIKAAFFGFQDRYRGIPGDYLATSAAANIPGAGATPCGGDGNSLIDTTAESICAWYHLSKSGFITGSYTGTGTSATTANSPSNAFGGLMQLIFNGVYLDSATTPPSVHNIKTGINIPSVALAEVDRKIDDGSPITGQFRYSSWNVPSSAACVTSGNTWDVTGGQTVCGGVSLF
jgi:prepilin-type N-terminal cleavage/methylation domain-containing protein